MAMRLARALLHGQINCSVGTSGTAFPILRHSFASEQLAAEELKPDPTVAGSVGAVSVDSAVELKPGEVGKVAGVPEQHLHRKVVIYSPSRVASQQGRSHLGKWKINFESTNKWENPLMGWTSTGDPYASVGEAGLSFDSKEAAVEFARKYGWEYTVKEPHHATLKPKAYADNFKWKGAPVMGDEQ